MLNFAKPKEICLRDYQEDAIQALRDGIRAGKMRQVLAAPTGAGKTVIASHLLREADRKGSYALFLVDRVSLVDQTSATLDNYDISHGVIQADHPRFDPYANIQVCSIQTLENRRLPRIPNLICYDEAHVRFAKILRYMDSLPDCVKIGLTATPFSKGMADDWDAAVNVRTTRSLIDDGYLIQPKIYVAKSPEDESLGLNKRGEFSEKDASSAGIQIIGDVVKEWVKKTNENFGGPVKTIVFSPTVEHGRELCAAFAAVGYDFQQISYLDKDDETRRLKIQEFRKPDSQIQGLVSCGVLTRGFDVTDVQCGISCRPYRKSLSSHMQEMGRVMRPHGHDKKAIWLCHSGNVERFSIDMFDVWENGVGELSHAQKQDSKPRERTEKTKEKVVCKECSGAMRGPTCTVCGWERPARSGINVIDGELQEFDLSKQSGMEPRAGLRAECLKDPRAVWQAALAFTSERTRKGENHARRWAYGVWCGIYPNNKLPFGWFDMPVPRKFDLNAYALIEREVKRFRKKGRAA
ncbi:putative helicase [Roseobacter sp. AzwK-3b]|uniref:DEAD/DEAH box helicase n=1 Tax=Roseobacter sp. AzwK-3b TaxID=351016 RepID=UPI000156A4E1|nr:DEAD/DEAH box helicase family protein [Roseobacter sp. AzwK-3b]EDM70816.1 putative helicase [Roseobacter sp. AzwK-3b]